MGEYTISSSMMRLRNLTEAVIQQTQQQQEAEPRLTDASVTQHPSLSHVSSVSPTRTGHFALRHIPLGEVTVTANLSVPG